MFLLIRLFGAKYNLYLSTLNSIMFLLIPEAIRIETIARNVL